MYLFTDNAGRTSGSGTIDPNSWYAKKYGADKKYASKTQAVARGLNNVYPITTMVDDKRTQWTDAQFDEYKKIIDDEIETIKQALKNYKGVKFGAEMPFGKGAISNMKDSAPKIWNYLNTKLAEIGIDNTGDTPVSTQPSTQPTVSTEVKESKEIKDLNIGQILDLVLKLKQINPSYRKIDEVFSGFFVSFLVDSKDEIKLRLESITKEGDNYRIISSGGKGAKQSKYNFLINKEGDIIETVSVAKGTVYKGENQGNVFFDERQEYKITVKELDKILKQELSPKVEGVTFDQLTEFTAERKQEIITNFAAKHKMTVEQAKSYINDAIATKGKEAVIAILDKTDEQGNKCY